MLKEKKKTGLLTENGYNSETKTFQVSGLLHLCYLFINKSSYFNPFKESSCFALLASKFTSNFKQGRLLENL